MCGAGSYGFGSDEVLGLITLVSIAIEPAQGILGFEPKARIGFSFPGATSYKGHDFHLPKKKINKDFCCDRDTLDSTQWQSQPDHLDSTFRRGRRNPLDS